MRMIQGQFGRYMTALSTYWTSDPQGAAYLRPSCPWRPHQCNRDECLTNLSVQRCKCLWRVSRNMLLSIRKKIRLCIGAGWLVTTSQELLWLLWVWCSYQGEKTSANKEVLNWLMSHPKHCTKRSGDIVLWKWKLYDLFCLRKTRSGSYLKKNNRGPHHFLKLSKFVASQVTKIWFLKLWIISFWIELKFCT